MDERGDTPLHLACRRGHKALALRLLESGANINAINEFGDTLLRIASSCDYGEILERFVSYCLLQCIEQGNFAALDLLVDGYATSVMGDVDIKDFVIVRLMYILRNGSLCSADTDAVKGRSMLVQLVMSADRHIRAGNQLTAKQIQMLKILLNVDGEVSLLDFARNGDIDENKKMLSIILNMFDGSISRDFVNAYVAKFE